MRASRWWAVGLVASLVGGCARADVLVSPGSIERVRGALKAGQPAVVDRVDGGTTRVRPDQRVEVILVDGSRFPMRLADVIANCPAHPEDSTRLCQLHDVADVSVGREWVQAGDRGTSAAGGTLWLAGTLAAGAGLGVCASACDDPYDDAAGWTLGGLGTLVVGGLVWIVYTHKAPK